MAVTQAVEAEGQAAMAGTLAVEAVSRAELVRKTEMEAPLMIFLDQASLSGICVPPPRSAEVVTYA